MRRLKNQFTKGPWHLLETKNLRNPDLKAYLLANSSPYIHGMLDGVEPKDAHLIAAAPEMLEAMQSVKDLLVDNCGGCPEIEQFLAVLKKAKGVE